MKGKKGKRVNFPSFLFQHSPLGTRAGVRDDTTALTQCQKNLKQEIGIILLSGASVCQSMLSGAISSKIPDCCVS